MHLRLRLPGGTLKIKTIAFLRSFERERQVPVRQVGPFYLIWVPNGFQAER